MSAPKDLLDTIAGLEKAKETLGEKPKHPFWHAVFTGVIATYFVNGTGHTIMYCSKCKVSWGKE